MLQLVLYGSLAGLALGLGALFVTYFGRPTVKFLSVMLGFAGGVTLAVAAFDLLPEAREMAGSVAAIIWLIVGVGMMAVLDVVLPHIHHGLKDEEGEAIVDAALVTEHAGHTHSAGHLDRPNLLKSGLLMVVGIALHNLPEGFAVGAGFSSSEELGLVVLLSLVLHNLPEGMATATPLLIGGLRKWQTVLLLSLAGLMTPIGTVIGALVLAVNEQTVGGALAFAAGAMIYVVTDELIPQSHQYHSHAASLGLLAGFISGFILG